MRLFAAVLPPVDVVDSLDRAVTGLRDLPGADDLRWTGREGWHLTLAFLGEVDEGLVPELVERLTRGARRTRPFSLRLSGGGRFGRTSLWAGTAGETEELRRLAERAAAAARRAGVGGAGGTSRFRGHVTLARTRREDVDLRPFASALEGYESGSWQVEGLALVRSLLPDGRVAGARPRYETLALRPLGKGAEGSGGAGR